MSEPTTLPGQLEQFIERTQHVPEPTGRTADNTIAKRVPFATALSAQLTGEQEQTMVEHALDRLAVLEGELGRDLVLQQNWAGNAEKMSSTQVVQSATDSFLGKRSRYEDVFANKVDWRPYLFGGIFKDSNLVVPLARRIARQMTARSPTTFSRPSLVRRRAGRRTPSSPIRSSLRQSSN